MKIGVCSCFATGLRRHSTFGVQVVALKSRKVRSHDFHTRSRFGTATRMSFQRGKEGGRELPLQQGASTFRWLRHTLRIWAFSMVTPCCANKLEIHTDPKACEYIVVSGGTRKVEEYSAEDAGTIELPDREETRPPFRDSDLLSVWRVTRSGVVYMTKVRMVRRPQSKRSCGMTRCTVWRTGWRTSSGPRPPSPPSSASST
eukprot:436894-Prorocentrum_minimum.AAC.2